MRVTPEMLKDYLSAKNNNISIYGKARCSFKDVRLPSENVEFSDDYLYLFTADDYASLEDKSMNAVVCGKLDAIPDSLSVSLIVADYSVADFFNQIRDCFLAYDEWFESVYEAIAIGESLETILEKSFPMLRNPIFIDDSSYRTLARLKDYPSRDFRDNEYIFMQQSGHHSAEYIYAMLNSDVAVESSSISPRPIIHRFEFLAHRTLYSTIKVNGEIVGFFSCIEIETTFTAGMMDVIEALTEMMAVALGRQSNMPTSRHKSLDNDLFLGVLNGSINDAELTKTAFSQVGLSKGDYFVVYIVTDVDSEQNSFLLPRIMELLVSNLEKSFPIADGSNIVLVVNTKLTDEIRETLVRLIKFYLGEFDAIIGISLGFDNPEKLPLYYDQALAATRLGPCINNEMKVFDYEYVVGYDVLEKFGDKEKRMSICHPAVFQLLKHDQEKKTNLLPTLKVFVECMSDTALAAEKLYLHRNSLYYRLKQIVALTGIDIQSETLLSHIALSLRILEINEEI